jgi:acyl dehydratase
VRKTVVITRPEPSLLTLAKVWLPSGVCLLVWGAHERGRVLYAAWASDRASCWYVGDTFDVRVLPGSSARLLQGPFSEAKLEYHPRITVGAVAAYERATVLAGGKALAKLGAEPSHISICYPEVLTVSLVAGLVVDRGFPLSPLGVIHIKQTMTQHAPIPIGGQYETRVWFSKSAETEKGVEVVVSVVLLDSKTDTKLWEGDTTLLSRGGGAAKKKAEGTFEKPVWTHQSLHSVAGNTGLKYAAVSGDYNPHHLYWWSAMPVGYSRPIAHGMWTLAAALHEVQACNADASTFPQRVVCEFKKPLFMPSKLTFGYKPAADGSIDFGVYCKDNVNPHIIANYSVGNRG